MKEQDESLFYLLKRAAEHVRDVRREQALRSRTDERKRAEIGRPAPARPLLDGGVARGFGTNGC
ncbi:MAG: hypothetical protein J7494_06200 [Sphingobium sp.]|nr:hypothetical protein [Sphingobium sp.]